MSNLIENVKCLLLSEIDYDSKFNFVLDSIMYFKKMSNIQNISDLHILDLIIEYLNKDFKNIQSIKHDLLLRITIYSDDTNLIDKVESGKSCIYAAMYGGLKCLKYAHNYGIEINSNVCNEAVKYNHLDCLKYIYECNCIFSTYTCILAAENGSYECLKYMLLLNDDLYDLYDNEIAIKAIEYGHLKCLMFLNEYFKISDNICVYAAIYGKLDCLKYLYENGYEFDSEACEYALDGGHLDCFKYMIDNNCELSSDITAIVNDVECLKYLCEKKYVFNDDIMIYAVINNKLDSLEFLYNNGYKYDKNRLYVVCNNDTIKKFIDNMV